MNGVVNSVRGLVTTVKQVAVLQRAEVADIRRPRDVAQTRRLVNALGPMAGPARISALRCPDTVALIDNAGSFTYRELDNSTDAVALAWLAQGLSGETVIGVLCRDHSAMVRTLIAGAKIGAKICLLNTGFGATQLRDVAQREGVTALFADDEFASITADLPDNIVRLDLESGAGQPGRRPPLPKAQGGFVILTGGTTGTPKGVPRKVQSPLAAAQFLDRVPMRRGGVTLLLAPLFHGTALSQFILSFSLGCTVVLHGKFDAQRALAQIQEHRCTSVVLVPTMLRRILDLGADVIGGYDTSSLKIIFCAGAALPSAVGNEAIERFGPVIYNFYGATETGTATIATPADWIAAPGTVGKAPVGIIVRLYDENGRHVTEPGGKGTVYVGNHIAFGGYSGGGSKKLIDGLMSTGDVGHFDAGGRLFIDGRDDDMIVSGGENVFPGEVEDLLYTHPNITEAAVIGVPDAEFGQRLSALIIPHGPITADEVRAFVKDNLARFKVPRDVRFVEELPRTPTGKISRAELHALATNP